MLTEFGLCYPNISEPLNKNTIECTKVMDLADHYFMVRIVETVIHLFSLWVSPLHTQGLLATESLATFRADFLMSTSFMSTVPLPDHGFSTPWS